MVEGHDSLDLTYKTRIPGNSDVVFGMEATGVYSLPLFSALKKMDIKSGFTIPSRPMDIEKLIFERQKQI